MIGYIFETTNNKTGETYLGKKLSVSFDKTYLGEDDDIAVAIEKYGRPSFSVKMIMPYESIEQMDEAFTAMVAERKPAKKIVVKEEISEEVKPAPRKRRSKAVEE